MDLEKALEKGTKMKFKPPLLEPYITELKVMEELFSASKTEEMKISVQAVYGLVGIIDNIGDKLRDLSEEVGKQIDEAPEPESLQEDDSGATQ